MGSMDIELVVPDCPHQSAAEAFLRTAIADVGLPAGYRVLTITDADDAALHGFAGSRALGADGLDLFPGKGQSTGLTCASTAADPEWAGVPTFPLSGRRETRRRPGAHPLRSAEPPPPRALARGRDDDA